MRRKTRREREGEVAIMAVIAGGGRGVVGTSSNDSNKQQSDTIETSSFKEWV